VSGGEQSDTAYAFLAEPVIVEVRNGAGQLVSRAPVVFGDSACPQGCAFRVVATATSPFATAAEATTDSRGRAAVWIQLGVLAGNWPLAITVPTLGFEDTVRLTVLPATAENLVIETFDRAIGRDRTVQLVAYTRDQFLNRRNDPVSFVPAQPELVSITPSGVATGQVYGRAAVMVSSAGLTGTLHLSIVPEGRLALGRWGDPGPAVAVNLDGSVATALTVSGTDSLNLIAPAWSPDASQVAFSFQDGLGQLYTSSIGGPPTVLVPRDPTRGGSAFPRYSGDGSWIYFHWDGAAPGTYEIWRVHPDGSGRERVGDASGSFGGDFFPDPSPDGTRVVFVTTRDDPTERLVVRTLATGVEQALGVTGTMPRWAPDGAWIAFWRAQGSTGLGALWLVRPDGSEVHQVSPDETFRSEGLDWSPDGQWLVGFDSGQPALLSLTTGAVLPIAQLHYHLYPAWAPLVGKEPAHRASVPR
jgi:Tol biopolymer transport system component